jgi:hypothetical protein
MRWRRSWPVLLAVLLPAGPARAENKEILDLLPASTLACLEVRQPERLSREVLALVKGSALEELPATMARFRATMGEEAPFWLQGPASEMILLLSPELIAEAGRMQGGAVALTGLGKDGSPQIVGFLQAGDSHLPSFYMRGYMTFTNVLPAGEVEGVTLYRERRRDWSRARKGALAPGAPPPQSEYVDSGPVMAQLPGLLVFGSSVDAVKDVVRRYKGKSAEPALSSVRAYREAAALRDRPGLFGHLDVEALAGQIEDAVKQKQLPAPPWNLCKAVINPEAMRSLSASLTLNNGNLELHARLRLDDRKKSPLLELLPEKPARVELLRHAPRETVLSLTLDLADGDRRWQKVVGLLDVVATVQGQSELNLPSKALKELEEKLTFPIGKGVLDRVAGASLLLVPGEKPGALILPLLVVEATEAEGARFLQEKLPLLVSLGADEAPRPARVDVEGLNVWNLPAPGLPEIKTLYYGRHGKTLVLGASDRGVARALGAESKKEGLLAQEKVALALKDLDGPVVLGVASVGQLLVQAAPNFGVFDQRRFQPVPVPKGAGPAPKVEPPKPPRVADKVMQAVNEAAANLPPLVLTVRRQKDELTLDARQPAIRPFSVRLLDLWVETMLEGIRERANAQKKVGGLGPGGAAEAERAARQAAEAAEAALQKEKAARQADAEARRKAEEERRQRERDRKP